MRQLIMLKEELINIAYKYYPKGICNIEERAKYLSSIEYKNLYNTINSPTIDIERKNILKELKNNTLLKNSKDQTLLSFDRCLTFEIEIVESNDTLIKICLNISTLDPYYIIYVLENEIILNPYRWKTLPKRNIKKEKTTYKKEIEAITEIIEKKMFKKFPEKFAKIIISDLSFQDARIGNFTIYNAYFHDDNKL